MPSQDRKVEVYVDGSLVFATREPAPPFEGEPIGSAREAAPWFASIQGMPQEVFAVMSLTAANRPIRTRWTTVGVADGLRTCPWPQAKEIRSFIVAGW